MDKAQFNRSFGEFVRFKRIQNNLSQSELGDMLGNNFQNISRLERGLISPSLYFVQKICEAFNLSISEFFLEFEIFKKSK